MKTVWYCHECEMWGVYHYYDSEAELLENHSVLKSAKHLISTKEVENKQC